MDSNWRYFFYEQNNKLSYISVFKYKFKSGSGTPVLSKVEFIVTETAITMFLVKLVFLLPVINIAHLLNSFGKSLKSNCEEELCFSSGFYPNRYIIVSTFSIF